VSGIGQSQNDEGIGTYRTYRLNTSFSVIAHSEDQARKRWDDFLGFLNALQTAYEFPHESMRFIYTDYESLEFTDLGETEVTEADMQPSMVSNMGHVRDWIDPESDRDYDPEEAAHKAYFGLGSDE
jgi:hypothetical protein